MIIDEAAAINPRLFFETIVPLLEMKRTTMIAISTPLDENNYFSTLVNLRDVDGSPFFYTYHIGLVCDACKKLPTAQEQYKCKHMDHVLPPWKSAAKNERFKYLYQETNNAAMGMRENAGVIISGANTVFKREHIERLFPKTEKDRLFDLATFANYPIQNAFLCCDPDADGNSELALVSGFVNTDNPRYPIGALMVCLSFLLVCAHSLKRV